MKIGTTKEIKNHEYRVGITPDNASAFVADSLGYTYTDIESII
jgi:alanine dehydrogenase